MKSSARSEGVETLRQTPWTVANGNCLENAITINPQTFTTSLNLIVRIGVFHFPQHRILMLKTTIPGPIYPSQTPSARLPVLLQFCPHRYPPSRPI